MAQQHSKSQAAIQKVDLPVIIITTRAALGSVPGSIRDAAREG